MSIWRTRPILTAALAGALFGLLYAIGIEAWGASGHPGRAVLALLMPGSNPAGGVNETMLTSVASLLFVEVAANILIYAALFAAPVAIVVRVRRLLRRRG